MSIPMIHQFLGESLVTLAVLGLLATLFAKDPNGGAADLSHRPPLVYHPTLYPMALGRHHVLPLSGRGPSEPRPSAADDGGRRRQPHPRRQEPERTPASAARLRSGRLCRLCGVDVDRNGVGLDAISGHVLKQGSKVDWSGSPPRRAGGQLYPAVSICHGLPDKKLNLIGSLSRPPKALVERGLPRLCV